MPFSKTEAKEHSGGLWELPTLHASLQSEFLRSVKLVLESLLSREIKISAVKVFVILSPSIGINILNIAVDERLFGKGSMADTQYFIQIPYSSTKFCQGVKILLDDL